MLQTEAKDLGVSVMGQLEDYLAKGEDLLKQQKYDKALAYYNRSLELSPDDPDALYNRGLTYYKLGRYDKALADYNRSLELSPDDPDALYNRGLTYHELGRYPEAQADYSKAIEINPKDGSQFLARGQLHAEQKILPDALSDLEKALKCFKEEEDADGVSLAEYWIEELKRRIEEERTKREPPVEVQIIRNISANLRRTPGEDPLKRIRDREKSYQEYFMRPRTITPDRNFLMVLRRWNSFTPKIPNREGKKGGGYFLVWKGKGVVIDPGFDFMDNFDRVGYSIRDIDTIILTHAHTDHTADLESMLNLVYELWDRVGSEHKVDLFMNLGTVNKFIGWVSRLKGIGNIVSLNAGDSIRPKGYDWTLNAKSARHQEIIGENAIGLVFELHEGPKVALKLGFTGDTGWSTSIQNQYRGCKLLVLHLGSIGQNEFDERLSLKSRKRLYNGHLGLIGTISMIKSLKPTLSIISEFGEELGIDRCHIAKSIDCAFGQDKRCLSGDIGFKIRLPDLAVYCNLCRNYQECTDIQEMTIKAREEIIYCCSSHTAQEVVDKLIV